MFTRCKFQPYKNLEDIHFGTLLGFVATQPLEGDHNDYALAVIEDDSCCIITVPISRVYTMSDVEDYDEEED